MIGIVKLLFTFGVAYVVWFAYKYRARIAAAHRTVTEEKAREAAAARTGRSGREPRPRETNALDLVPCPKCGAYTPAGTTCTCDKG